MILVSLYMGSKLMNFLTRSGKVVWQAMLGHWGRWWSFSECAEFHRIRLKLSSATWRCGGKVHLRPGMGTAKLSGREGEGGHMRWMNWSWMHRWPDWSCYVWGCRWPGWSCYVWGFNFHRRRKWRRGSGHVCSVCKWAIWNVGQIKSKRKIMECICMFLEQLGAPGK